MTSKVSSRPRTRRRRRKAETPRSRESKGVSYGGVEHSREYDRGMTRQKKAEERKWKSLNGPVTVRKIGQDA